MVSKAGELAQRGIFAFAMLGFGAQIFSAQVAVAQVPTAPVGGTQAGTIQAGNTQAGNTQADPPPQEPLSIIDWLSSQRLSVVTGPVLIEPQVTPGVFAPSVEVMPLAPSQPTQGLVPPNVTGLSSRIWQGSDPIKLARLIARVPVVDSPSMQRLLYSLLLSDSIPPSDDRENIVLLARLDRLLALGAAEPALALADLTGPTLTAGQFARWFSASLMLETEMNGCLALGEQPHLSPDLNAQVYCAARRGNWSAAQLIAETAIALGRIPPDDGDLLLRFLIPEGDDTTDALPVPRHIDPVRFRIFEAIGEPLNTARLPRLYANADLRDIAGWKAQLHAGERLAAAGAINPNHLLGIYTAHDPAASGGVWERVSAVQKLDKAIAQGEVDAIQRLLPDAWRQLSVISLEVPFAAIFTRHLSQITFTDPKVNALAWRIALLDTGFRDTATKAPDTHVETQFLQAIALGIPAMTPPTDSQATAISAGLSQDAKVPARIQQLLDDGAIGEALLRAIILFDSGSRGNLADLSAALASLRASGLRDIAKRAALEVRLLDRRG
jgi:hypothetical protein